MSPKNNFQHGTIASRLLIALGNHAQQGRLGVVLDSSTGFWMRNRNCRAPDVSFIAKGRLSGWKPSAQEFFAGAPDLAVEILSPNNTRSEIDGRLKDFFESGTVVAWIIDPDAQRAELCHSLTQRKLVGSGGFLKAKTFCPGSAIPSPICLPTGIGNRAFKPGIGGRRHMGLPGRVACLLYRNNQATEGSEISCSDPRYMKFAALDTIGAQRPPRGRNHRRAGQVRPGRLVQGLALLAGSRTGFRPLTASIFPTSKSRSACAWRSPSWAPPSSSSARCSARGPTSSVPRWPGNWPTSRPPLPADPPETVRATIEAELGQTPEPLFAEFDETPMASASIAQVHRARLHTGEEVVVKVQHAGIADRILPDLDILGGLAELAEKHAPQMRPYQPSAVVRQFRRTLLRELDFTFERRNLEEFAANISPRTPPCISPAPTRSSPRRRVLTMERLDGILGTDSAGARGVGRGPERIRPAGRHHVSPDDLPRRVLPRRPASREPDAPARRRGRACWTAA